MRAAQTQLNWLFWCAHERVCYTALHKIHKIHLCHLLTAAVFKNMFIHRHTQNFELSNKIIPRKYATKNTSGIVCGPCLELFSPEFFPIMTHFFLLHQPQKLSQMHTSRNKLVNLLSFSSSLFPPRLFQSPRCTVYSTQILSSILKLIFWCTLFFHLT